MLGPDYIEHFTDAAQGAMDEYTLRLVCIYAALIGSIDFEGESAYSQAARKAALAAKDVQKAMGEEGRRAAREAAKAAAEAVAMSAESDLAALGTAMGALSKAMQWRLHNSARATAAGVQEVVSRDNLKMPANVQRAYLEVVAQAVAQVNSGMAGYEKATRDAVLKLARRGVSVVDYKSGAWAQADVAAVLEAAGGKLAVIPLVWVIRLPLEVVDKLCQVYVDLGIKRVKTSPGIHFGDMKVEHVEYLARHFGDKLGIEVAGRCRSREKAEAMTLAGAESFHISQWRRIGGIGYDIQFDYDAKRADYAAYQDRL